MSDAQKLLPPVENSIYPIDTLTLFRSDAGNFSVRMGERHADRLTDDEALFVVAAWIIAPDKKPPYLRTEAEQREWEERLTRIAKELPIVTAE